MSKTKFYLLLLIIVILVVLFVPFRSHAIIDIPKIMHSGQTMTEEAVKQNKTEQIDENRNKKPLITTEQESQPPTKPKKTYLFRMFQFANKSRFHGLLGASRKRARGRNWGGLGGARWLARQGDRS